MSDVNFDVLDIWLIVWRFFSCVGNVILTSRATESGNRGYKGIHKRNLGREANTPPMFFYLRIFFGILS